ncbi:bleomycin resistance protein [Terrabacter sp. Soil811]|nr:bleomycin resistance protein [Terrabacter sp. Soil811]
MDVSVLAVLLREAEEHHGPYEAAAPKHHWSDWYAAYITARQGGRTTDQAVDEASRALERLLGGR